MTTGCGYLPSELVPMADGLADPVIGSQVTASRVSKKLQTHRLIALVHIDSGGEIVYYDPRQNGTPEMVLHWVVIEAVSPFGFNDGEVTLFNPFPNNLEKIAFRLLLQSMFPNQSGLWIPRKGMPIPSGTADRSEREASL